MGIEDKIDKLHTLIETLSSIEEYELCHQIKTIIDRYNNNSSIRERVNDICPKCSNLLDEDRICWKCITK